MADGYAIGGMRAAVAIGLIVVAARVAGAQDAPDSAAPVSAPEFDVASVRTNTGGGSTSYSYRWFPGGRFSASNVSLLRLVHLAFDLRSEHQLLGAPGWIASERFDIEAVPAVTVDQTPQRLMMLQALLRDRFRLVVRVEPVEVPVYALVRTRADAPLPPTLRESTCTVAARRDPSPLMTAAAEPPAGTPYCGVGLDRDRGRISGTAGSIGSLLVMLRQLVDRRIVDRTGLTGRYDFELTWSPDPDARSGTAIAHAAIFSAIQDLGLKLQPVLAPADGYEIERIERPTPN